MREEDRSTFRGPLITMKGEIAGSMWNCYILAFVYGLYGVWSRTLCVTKTD